MGPETLLTYPYVIVRIDCEACSRSGRYRLARLAQNYGADIDLDTLLGYLTGDCKHWEPRRPHQFRCRARFCDLPPRRPPDRPGMRLNVVKDGRP